MTQGVQSFIYPWDGVGVLDRYQVKASVVNSETGEPIRLWDNHDGTSPLAHGGLNHLQIHPLLHVLLLHLAIAVPSPVGHLASGGGPRLEVNMVNRIF